MFYVDWMSPLLDLRQTEPPEAETKGKNLHNEAGLQTWKKIHERRMQQFGGFQWVTSLKHRIYTQKFQYFCTPIYCLAV